MPVFRKRVRDAFMVISVFSEWPESLGAVSKALSCLPAARIPPRLYPPAPRLASPRPTPRVRAIPSLLCCLLICRQFRSMNVIDTFNTAFRSRRRRMERTNPWKFCIYIYIYIKLDLRLNVESNIETKVNFP